MMRASARNAKDDRFCKIKIDEEAGTLVIVPGTGPDDFDDFVKGIPVGVVD
jgi:hypothetical protein